MTEMKTILPFIAVAILFSSCKSSISPQEKSPDSSVMSYDISNQQIKDIAEDKNGYIWIATFRGLNRYNGKEFRQYFKNYSSLGISDSQVNDILCDSKGRVWIATINGLCQYTDMDTFVPVQLPDENHYINKVFERSDGNLVIVSYPALYLLNPESGSAEKVVENLDPLKTFYIKTYPDGNGNLWVVDNRQIRCYRLDNFHIEHVIDLDGNKRCTGLIDGCLWLYTESGMRAYDIESKEFIHLPDALIRNQDFSSSEVILSHKYEDDDILFCTSDARIFCYDRHKGLLISDEDSGFPFEKPGFVVSTMFTDSHKNLWIGSVDQGFKTIYHYKKRFNDDNALKSAFSGKSIKSVSADSNNIYIATTLYGLFKYNVHSGITTKISADGKLETEKNKEIYGTFIDNEGFLWTLEVDCVKKNSIASGRFSQISSYPVFAPMSMAQSDDGTLWITTASQYILYMSPGMSGFAGIKIFDTYTFIPSITRYNEGKMLVCGFGNRMKLIDTKTFEISDLPVSEEDWNACMKSPFFIPVDVHYDKNGYIWIGTVANGILRYDTKQGSLISVPGAACSDISSIEEDDSGCLWIGTLYGLSKLNPQTLAYTNYFATDGLGGNQFYDRASCRLSDGRLVFGGTHGLTSFYPKDSRQRVKIPLVFEDLKVHNVSIVPEKNGCIEKMLAYSPSICLQHSQNSFGISFAALDYSEFERVRYEYMLEGFDRYWVEAGHNREAYYANLPAGKYIFNVRISSNDSGIEPIEKSIKLRVMPSPWLSWWAWLIYAFIVGGVAIFLINISLKLRKERRSAEIAKREKSQEHLINQMNMRFFANVSHEFRTPLTLISGPVSQLLESGNLKESDKNLITIVRRSVDRMLKLVNQMMDFNKLEEDTLILQVSLEDAVSVLSKLVDVFRYNIANKGITLKTTGFADSFFTLLDEDKLDKIIGNLMSNAFKFTPEGGRIEIDFDVTDSSELVPLFGEDVLKWRKYVKISITNSGTDIPASEMEKIFERYYQVKEESSQSRNMGTGIGLYYAKRLIELHHGFIRAVQPEMHGAQFVFAFPVDEQAYDADAKLERNVSQSDVFPLPIGKKSCSNVDDECPSVMVVDDDTEIALYLKTLLSPYYKVTCRFDADSALKAIRENAPGCIICDVVMPGKDGFELCANVRSDVQLCHLPIILVTANVASRSQVKGLDSGANAYVAKPFDPEYLLAMVRSQIQIQKNIHRILSSSTQTENMDDNILSPRDKKFIDALYELMEKELSNSELNIIEIAERMYMSRTKFYYKVKGLTGENPGVFFKTYKLNRAAELIKEGKYTISEISDMVGFSNISVFSKSFKKRFGVSPSNYKAQ